MCVVTFGLLVYQLTLQCFICFPISSCACVFSLSAVGGSSNTHVKEVTGFSLQSLQPFPTLQSK